MHRLFRILPVLVLVFSGSVLAGPWPVVHSYSNAALARVKMPLGGIGTGTVSLNGRGGLVDFELQNQPAKGYVPRTRDWPPAFTPSFAIRCRQGERTVARLLEGPLDFAEYEGDMGSRAPNAGFPRFARTVFHAAYPLARIDYEDESVPARVALEAMNPLVPGDAAASGIPVALLRWRVTNPTDAPLEVSVCGSFVNFAGRVPYTYSDAGIAQTLRSVGEGPLRGVVFAGAHTNDVAEAFPADGEFALLAPADRAEVTTASDIREPGAWGVAMDRWWRRFLATGTVADTGTDDSTATERLPLGQVAARVTLAPGETKAIPFVLAWRFPNRQKWFFDAAHPKRSDLVGNWYATRFPTARAAAEFFWARADDLEAKTVAFVESVLARDAPAVVKEAALFNLSTLRTETCFRAADGHFFAWEGCGDSYGSCHGNCTHVWGYEHALVDLWPDLARSMLDLNFGPMSDGRGHMVFRVGLPLAVNARKECPNAAADGQMQCLVKAYEYVERTGDAAWLARTWPRIRKALEFAWIPGGWDGDRDGVMEGCQHNTMDVDYFGPNPQMEFLYLAALEATARLAERAGEADFAKTCRDLAARGSAWTEANLFNGAYYEHRIVPPQGPVAEGLRNPLAAKDLSNPDYQLGAGCLIDQLLGDFSARSAGCRPVADRAHARTTLRTILEKCRKAPDDAAFNPMRAFALAGETSLRMAWYPDGKLPRSPFPYYRETMTGFEYVVAALLAWEGERDEATRVVADIRDRYDGTRRNPFDEAECGHHYARALAAWTVLKAFGGTAK